MAMSDQELHMAVKRNIIHGLEEIGVISKKVMDEILNKLGKVDQLFQASEAKAETELKPK